MPGWEMNDPLGLESIGIEAAFQREYKRVIAALDKGEKGSITIKLDIKRDKEMDTMVEMASSISSKVPAKKRKSMGRIGENAIFVESVPEKPANVLTLDFGEGRV